MPAGGSAPFSTQPGHFREHLTLFRVEAGIHVSAAARFDCIHNGRELVFQNAVAAAFALRCKDEITAHTLAALTLSALSIAYRVWFSGGKRDIEAAVERVFAEFKKAVGGR